MTEAAHAPAHGDDSLWRQQPSIGLHRRLATSSRKMVALTHGGPFLWRRTLGSSGQHGRQEASRSSGSDEAEACWRAARCSSLRMKLAVIPEQRIVATPAAGCNASGESLHPAAQNSSLQSAPRQALLQSTAPPSGFGYSAAAPAVSRRPDAAWELKAGLALARDDSYLQALHRGHSRWRWI